MSVRRVQVAGVVIALLASALLGSGGTAGASQPTRSAGESLAASSSSTNFVFIQTSSQTFTQAVTESVSEHSENLAKVAALLPIWMAGAKSGRNLKLGETTVADQHSVLLQLQSQLSSGSSLQHQSDLSTVGPKATPAPSASKAAGTASKTFSAVPFIDHNNQNSFPVRGGVGSGRTSWTGLWANVEQWSCNTASGDCEVTDKMEITATVNPGTLTDRIDLKKVYFPNDTGAFGNCVNLQFSSINRSNVTGIGFADGFCKTSQSFYQGNGNHNYRGDVLTVAVAVEVSAISGPNDGANNWDGAKTADATCSSTSTNVCKY